jgi:hypothetical protein
VAPIYDESKNFTRIAYSLLVIVLLLAVGATVFHTLENLSWLDSFYLATITLTTIGYGDITPHHDYTKIFLIFYALIGVGTVLLLMTNISRYYIERRESAFEAQFTDLKRKGPRAKFRIPAPPTAHSRYHRR